MTGANAVATAIEERTTADVHFIFYSNDWSFLRIELILCPIQKFLVSLWNLKDVTSIWEMLTYTTSIKGNIYVDDVNPKKCLRLFCEETQFSEWREACNKTIFSFSFSTNFRSNGRQLGRISIFCIHSTVRQPLHWNEPKNAKRKDFLSPWLTQNSFALLSIAITSSCICHRIWYHSFISMITSGAKQLLSNDCSRKPVVSFLLEFNLAQYCD